MNAAAHGGGRDGETDRGNKEEEDETAGAALDRRTIWKNQTRLSLPAALTHLCASGGVAQGIGGAGLSQVSEGQRLGSPMVTGSAWNAQRSFSYPHKRRMIQSP